MKAARTCGSDAGNRARPCSAGGTRLDGGLVGGQLGGGQHRSRLRIATRSRWRSMWWLGPWRRLAFDRARRWSSRRGVRPWGRSAFHGPWRRPFGRWALGRRTGPWQRLAFRRRPWRLGETACTELKGALDGAACRNQTDTIERYIQASKRGQAGSPGRRLTVVIAGPKQASPAGAGSAPTVLAHCTRTEKCQNPQTWLLIASRVPCLKMPMPADPDWHRTTSTSSSPFQLTTAAAAPLCRALSMLVFTCGPNATK